MEPCPVNRCMPWPLGVLCVLDNLRHPGYTAITLSFAPAPCSCGKICRLHDKAMTWWWVRFPASEARFSSKHFRLSP